MYDIIATSAFGVESVTARELKNLGYEDVRVFSGGAEFKGSAIDIARANIWLRTADRVLLKLTEFRADTFEQLFEGVRTVPWTDILPEDAFVHVTGSCVRSVLHSVPACQAIAKKAILEKLKEKYAREVFSEAGAEYRINISLLKDIVTVTMDTSGRGLHKRGYRRLAGAAPLKETLACAMLLLSYWKDGRTLVDPFCGSGTIPIEAAMIASNRAPGMKRGFAAENWGFIDSAAWPEARREAADKFDENAYTDICGSDIDSSALQLAALHAEDAGVDAMVRFSCRDFKTLRSDKQYGFIITNPPYGQRLDSSAEMYREMGRVFSKLDTWSYYVICDSPDFEKLFGRKADKRRKLYNGGIECQYYQFFGPKPPKNRDGN